MDRVNAYFVRAETVTMTSAIEETLSCLTCGLTEFCHKNQYAREMIALQNYLNELNNKYEGLNFIHPINNGFLAVCFIGNYLV